MECPMCKQDKFIELKTSRETYCYGDYGWSIKECLSCGYKVRDKTFDGRFVGIDEVLVKPNISSK